MKSEIYVNISEYKEETTIPILNIVTDECTEYSISSYFILPKNSAKSNESLWVQTEKNEKVLVKFGEQSFSEYKEGTIDFIAEYAEPKKKTEIIIKCLQDQCSTFKSRTISLDFKAEKIEYEMQKIAERKKLVEEEERKRAYQKKMEEHQRLFEIERKAIMKEQRKIDAANRLQEIRKLPINTLNEEERKVKINDAKKLCIDLGFAPKTAKLRECILELM